MNASIYVQRIVPLAGVALNRLRFPRLWTGLRVEITGSGRLSYGAGVRIGEGSRLELGGGSVLHLGSKVWVGRNVHFIPAPGSSIVIAAGTGIQDACRLFGEVRIGRGCIFAPNVFISSGAHTFDALPHRTILEQERLAPMPSRPVRIHDDCWIGVNAVVAPGVTIARGCVVGANSVVTHDLPPYSVAAGSPARVLRARLDFAPKRRIDAAEERDGPYFYEGFESPQDGEARAAGDFILALRHGAARAVRLCLSGDAGQIVFHGVRAALTAKASIVEFPLPPAAQCGDMQFLGFTTTAGCRVRWAELA